MYIEPCCCDRQLPQVLRSGVPFFQTSGDVTFDKLLAACSSMAGSEFSMTLVVPEVDVAMLRVLNHYFSRGWMSVLRLCTQESQEELVRTELSGYLPRVTYATDPLVIDALCAMTGTALSPSVGQPNATVILQGAMLSEPDFSLTLYGCYFGNNADCIDAVMKTADAKFSIKGKKLDS